MAARCVEDTRKLGRVEGLRATQPVALCPGILKVPHSLPLGAVSTDRAPYPPWGELGLPNTLCSGAAKARSLGLSRAGLVPRTSASPSG